jgi:dipeptidyl aminopeptidase/acylaminoacyl peptidase
METPSKKIASFGTWSSPISAEDTSIGSTIKQNMVIDQGKTYYVETRPANKGRYTIVKRDKENNLADITPPDFNARTFVHEYGGGAFTVKNGTVYASSGADNAIYVIESGREPVKLTDGQTRFADMIVTSKGLIAVGEHHEKDKPVENFLAHIDLKTGKYKKIASGYDFYSSPAISADEKKIAWISWNHPYMPWTNTELWIADIDDAGTLTNQKRIAGDIPESIFQPQWSPDDVLYFVTDRDQGWWNIHRYNGKTIENVLPLKAEVGEPLWIFGRSTYAFLGKSKIIFTYNRDGIWHLGLLNLETKQWRDLGNTGVSIQQIRSGDGFAQFLESYPDKGEALIQVDDKPDFPMHTLLITEQKVNEGYVSKGKHISFPSNGRTAYGFYYPPTNKDFEGPKGELPPLVVMVHGGPVSQARGAFQIRHQYWTSRGFAVLDVNYGGSTGYGRTYRNLLNGKWGIVDVEDCINGAEFLAAKGLVDKNKLIIRGGSAGGFTTLAALTKGNTFKAGGNYFGVADITAMALDTHKFEKYDMGVLVGDPQDKELWIARSPLSSVDKIVSPLIIFQGEDDQIVPKNQSQMIYDALKAKGIKTEIHIYPGEEHGFRQAANIIHSLKRELEFYLEVFGNTK